MATKPCTHRYVLEQPGGAEIAGRCRLCGATRTWPASPEHDASLRSYHKGIRPMTLRDDVREPTLSTRGPLSRSRRR